MCGVESPWIGADHQWIVWIGEVFLLLVAAFALVGSIFWVWMIIARGAFLHDVGLNAIPDAILRKSDTLTLV